MMKKKILEFEIFSGLANITPVDGFVFPSPPGRPMPNEEGELKFKLESAKESLLIARRKLNQKEIKASVSGQVVDLQKQAVGSVIRPAEKIMDLVPGDEMLLVETEIMPNLIDRVAVKDLVDIRFSNFSSLL